MKIVKNPARELWPSLLQRPELDDKALEVKVQAVLGAVKQEGDVAVQRYTQEFDGVVLSKEAQLVSEAEIAAAIEALPSALKAAIEQAAKNIRLFHNTQVGEPVIVETMPGVKCWRKSVGIERVGLYIPGGSAPLFSTILMLGIPAQIAVCKEVVLCSPPNKQGGLHPAILFAANLVGIQKIYKIGGVQAIAAMAYGTQTIPKVSKIFGPGNQYVTCAKRLVQQEGIAIDMPAGPSEVCVLADASANPVFVAADLLSQAEHGADSQVLLVTDSAELANEVEKELTLQLAQLSRKELAIKSLDNSTCILIEDMKQGLELVNAYAAEHLIIATAQPELLAEQVVNAGSIFLGNYSPESVGDYASGTNHTLPTNGYARAYSGVSVDSFVKKITFQQLSPQGLKAIAPIVDLMAMAEGLDAHANAVRVRVDSLHE
ncbi:MAG: histidinol dehydrogenase [Bacteroidetes bacterium 24-39-8]|jgi:histidinol dehydrogenase|nr:MAG: histidinol dehydrogenase [Sphingobacteriia bacterium 35-40-8]OYZ50739.1 MAG: histidinol dehydrogenase [Bacteroidetes bacterium 24-39-8]OZA67528.1 MAG: histidinol dehydrogenase [Sphingobacteriia bacterium 39-39-8]HQR93601.1 histidinol dehydrogenase [Sediminibacterium sp.]HQS55796.1 histidinol dehydrogenase [Sediminibacterium sp.]